MLSQFLRLSLVSFNGSKNCNRETAEAFYESYLDRKKQIIEKNKRNYYRGAPITEKSHDEVYLFNEAYQCKKEVLYFIKVLLKERIK